jgi:hypothetical protein
MKSLVLPILAIFFLVSCERIEGQLNVTTDVKLINSDGASRLIRVGTYAADIKANTSKKITLRLNNDGDEKYTFALPSSVPSNGDFAYSSKQIGQPVDLNGNVTTAITNSPSTQRVETCTYTQNFRVCHPGPGGRMYCTTESRTIVGRKMITFYDRRTDKNVNLSIKAPGTNTEVADFHGDIAWIDRIITRETQCR